MEERAIALYLKWHRRLASLSRYGQPKLAQQESRQMTAWHAGGLKSEAPGAGRRLVRAPATGCWFQADWGGGGGWSGVLGAVSADVWCCLAIVSIGNRTKQVSNRDVCRGGCWASSAVAGSGLRHW